MTQKLRKVYKTIEQENGKVTIYGSNKSIQLVTRYGKDENGSDDVTGFRYRDQFVNLDDVIRTHNNPWCSFPADHWIMEFDGYADQSFGCGILVKVDDDGETIRAYTYIC